MEGAPGQVPPRSWLDPRIELRTSPLGGCGLFASEPIREGETVLIWGGASYTDEVGAQGAMRAGKAVMQWDTGVYSVETDDDDDDVDDDDAFKINHGCDPNVWMRDAFTLVPMGMQAAALPDGIGVRVPRLQPAG